MWLGGAQLGPGEVRDWGDASSKVKGNPGRASWPPSQEERRLAEGLDQRWVWGWGRNQALGVGGGLKVDVGSSV